MAANWGPRPADSGDFANKAGRRPWYLWSPASLLPPQLRKIVQGLLILSLFGIAELILEDYGLFIEISGNGIRAYLWLLVAQMWWSSQIRAGLKQSWRRVGDIYAVLYLIEPAAHAFTDAIFVLARWPHRLVHLWRDGFIPPLLIGFGLALLWAESDIRRWLGRQDTAAGVRVQRAGDVTIAAALTWLWLRGFNKSLISYGILVTVLLVAYLVVRDGRHRQPGTLTYRISRRAAQINNWLIRHGSIFAIYFPSPPFDLLAFDDPIKALSEQASKHNLSGFYGADTNADLRFAETEHAVLVLGPPRTGKTSCVFIPSIVTAAGPVVSTSTKTDIMAATTLIKPGNEPAPTVVDIRKRKGRVWHFDPTGHADTPDGVEPLRWSPIKAADTWDQAVRTAHVMVGASPAGRAPSGENGYHFIERAKLLLAVLLYAAAKDNRTMSELLSWVMKHDTTEPTKILGPTPLGPGQGAALNKPTQLAANAFESITKTADRERSSIWSTTGNILAAYNTQAALDIADNADFDPAKFAMRDTDDTIFITAPATDQALAAPIIAALLDAIKDETYTYHQRSDASTLPPVLFALDEAANIAPLPDLPQLVSEAGGQGLQILAAFQDLSQARHRWGDQADGFLSLFTEKLVFPGIADTNTLQALETIASHGVVGF